MGLSDSKCLRFDSEEIRDSFEFSVNRRCAMAVLARALSDLEYYLKQKDSVKNRLDIDLLPDRMVRHTITWILSDETERPSFVWWVKIAGRDEDEEQYLIEKSRKYVRRNFKSF